MLSETSLRPCISASMRSSMTLRLPASRSSSSPVPAIGSRPMRSPSMMVRVVSVMASTRLSTRRVTKNPPARPSTTTIAIDQRPAPSMMSCSRSRSSRSRPTSRRKPPGNLQHPHQRLVLGGGLRIVDAAIGGLGPARLVEDAGGQRADIAGDALAGRGGEQIEARARPAAAIVDGEDQSPDAALLVEVGQAGDLGVDRRDDLLGHQAAGVPGEIGEQEGRKQREHRQVDERQLEGGRPKELAECRHALTFTRRPQHARFAGRIRAPHYLPSRII